MSETRTALGERTLPGVVFKLSQTQDQLKLFIECEAKEDFPGIQLEELRELLKDVPEALRHDEVLHDISTSLLAGKKMEPRRVAQGKAPIPGRDGKLLLLVKPFKGDFKAGELERVDPKYVRVFDNIEVGATVARIYPPAPGKPGVTVFGVAITPPEGKPAKVEPDATTLERKVEQSFETLVSKVVGFLLAKGDKVSVETVLKIATDVGYKTGDIDFIGGIQVKGSVQKDFEVSARQDITIGEGINCGTVKSSNGSVTIKAGAIGELLSVIHTSAHSLSTPVGEVKAQRKSEIAAKTFVQARSLEGIFVEAGGDVIVEKEVRSSVILSRGALRIPKGSLVGGVTQVICGIEANIIGSSGSSRTEINLLSDVESSAEYHELVTKLTSHISAEKTLELHLGPFAVNPSQIQTLNAPQRVKLNKLSNELSNLRRSKAALEEQLRQLMATAKFNRLLRVNVHGKLFPGATITVGKHVFSVGEALVGPKTIDYLPAEEKFVVKDLEALQCELI